MIRHLAYCAALVCLTAPAFAQGVPGQNAMFVRVQSPAPAVGPDVVLVRVAGPWQANGQRGFSRLVGTAAAGSIALSVEWVSDSGAVVQSMPLTSPPGSQNLPLARMRGQTGPEDSALYLDTGNDTFVLIVGAPGTAKFGPASN